MKKIIAITAMAAVVAASAMAVEVSGNVKWSGAVLDGDLNEATIITANGPEASVTFAGENAGAEFKIELSGDQVPFINENGTLVVDDDGNIVRKNVAIASTASIWFSPIDALKITVGNELSLDAYGYGKMESGDFVCDFTAIDGLTISAGLDGDFLKIAKGSDAEWKGAIGLKAAYSADFGNIAAAARIKKDDVAIGLGYNGSTAGVSYEAAVQIVPAKEVALDAYGKVGYGAGNFAADAKATFGYTKADTKLEVEANASYNFAPASASVKVSTDDLIDNDFTVKIEPKVSVSGTVGAVSCSTGVELTVEIPTADGADVAFGYKIPVAFSVAL